MTNKHNPKFQELVGKLREIFQIDRPELDFGIYRILNARAGEINDYLENRLAEKVQATLSAGSVESSKQPQADLEKAIQQAQGVGINPDDAPKVKDLRAKLKDAAAGSSEHENAVFSHLLAFFSRYYEQGDFISQRRYKGETYAIPYAGEEVMLHWANKDQYYTKSGENFSNYSFKLEDGRTVHFRLTAADTAKDNRKDNDKERRFALVAAKTVIRVGVNGDEYEEDLLPVEEVQTADGSKELVIRFEYTAQPKGTKQEALVKDAVETVLEDAAVKVRWLALGNRAPTEKNPQRTLLEKHLTDYTTKKTADYFIHKNLNSFLRRELDFYIKNEVMYLDDVQNAGAFADIEKNLRMIQCLRSIALDLVAFLAQLEDFQKKLWLKKKFVVSSHYCITLDRVPEALWPEVAANEQQWARWKQLKVWDGNGPGTMEDLKAAPYWMVDTSLFSVDFKSSLLQQAEVVDSAINGLLIHGDNFQALNFLGKRFRGEIKCTYIDPPYNTGRDGFMYKDGYQRSSWGCLIREGLAALHPLVTDDGIVLVSNDDNENENLKKILSDLSYHVKANLVWNTDGHTDNQFDIKINHEYVTLSQKSNFAAYGDVVDPNTRIESNLWKNIAENSITKNGPGNPYSEVILPRGFPVSSECGAINVNVPEPLFFEELGTQNYFPRDLIRKHGVSFPIRRNRATYSDFKLDNDLKVCAGWANLNKLQRFIRNGFQPLSDEGGSMEFYLTSNGTVYYKKTKTSARNIVSVLRNFSTTEKMKYTLEGMGLAFSYPKPKELISYLLKIGASPIYLDYFAGSGTTAHAVIDLNREDNEDRKYILVEHGQHFETVIKPRLQKVVFSTEWASEKPTAPDTGISHCFKVLKLESYEDTLNNLQLRRTSEQGDLLNTLPQQAKDDYLLNYQLDMESRASLLSVEDFKKPFDYTLNVAVDSAGAFEPRKIDLVETFNYLIGLRVKHIDAQPQRGFVTVTGNLPSNETCLVLWRDCDVVDYEGVAKLCDKLAINPADNEFDVVYINGDHNIPTVLTQTAEEGGATRVLKLRQIEPEFLECMFSVEDI
ncbi:MAG: site-specific DNA-methyltransferase [Acetobacter orientalis]